MRSPKLILVFCAATLAACGSQSLNGNHTGTGGFATATGGVPGFGGAIAGGSFGTGGSVGTVCDALVQQYQSAIGAAQFCDVGAMGACSQPVPSSLGACGGCTVYVSDTSALDAIRLAYGQANCRSAVTTPPCALIDCAAAANNVCVSIDGGSRGYCSYVPGTGGAPGAGGSTGAGGSYGTGGSTGAGGTHGDGGISECGSLAAEYSALLTAEQVCSPNLDGQCGQAVPQSLSPCLTNCLTYVNDATGLNAIQTHWKQSGCANVAVLCPAIACPTPAAGYCGPGDAGPGTCVNAYAITK